MTGVKTCALPISGENSLDRKGPEEPGEKAGEDGAENKDEGA